MIYNSLDTIPYKLFLKIEATGNVALLSDEEEKDIPALAVIWEKLNDEHLSKHQTSESKKIFKLSKSVDEMVAMNKFVQTSCLALQFDFNSELVDLLIGYGYKLSTESTEQYYADIEIINRESEAYLVKAERFKAMLPEPTEEGEQKYTLDDVMASYTVILGFDFDFNLITYTKYFALQNQVNAKIEAMKPKK